MGHYLILFHRRLSECFTVRVIVLVIAVSLILHKRILRVLGVFLNRKKLRRNKRQENKNERKDEMSGRKSWKREERNEMVKGK